MALSSTVGTGSEPVQRAEVLADRAERRFFGSRLPTEPSKLLVGDSPAIHALTIGVG